MQTYIKIQRLTNEQFHKLNTCEDFQHKFIHYVNNSYYVIYPVFWTYNSIDLCVLNSESASKILKGILDKYVYLSIHYYECLVIVYSFDNVINDYEVIERRESETFEDMGVK